MLQNQWIWCTLASPSPQFMTISNQSLTPIHDGQVALQRQTVARWQVDGTLRNAPSVAQWVVLLTIPTLAHQCLWREGNKGCSVYTEFSLQRVLFTQSLRRVLFMQSSVYTEFHLHCIYTEFCLHRFHACFGRWKSWTLTSLKDLFASPLQDLMTFLQIHHNQSLLLDLFRDKLSLGEVLVDTTAKKKITSFYLNTQGN